jgi:hypothetical protein
MERRKKRNKLRNAEDAIKQEVRRRDGHRCRYPGCPMLFSSLFGRLEVAHLNDKGMGGDKRLIRTRRDRMILLCFGHHQGPRSLHSGDLRIDPETQKGTDGPCAFWMADEQRKWRCVGVA